MTELPVLVVTTHVHWDHIGGHGLFADIAVHEADAKWLAGGFPVSLSSIKSNLMRKPCDFPKEFDINGYQIFQGNPTRILKDGDIIDFGNRHLAVIHTPGHSPGHICLYEIERGYLFSGDLIYKGSKIATLINCPITSVTAAPRIPIFSGHINIGSNITFTTEPII